MPSARADSPAEDENFGSLLVQLGFHLWARLADALAPLGLEPRHYGLMRELLANPGQSQQALGEMLGLNPTRMVFLIDDLEQHGFVERRRNPADRRSHAIYLTGPGRKALGRADLAQRRINAGLCSGLTPAERKELTRLLRIVADDQGIGPETLPGVAQVRRRHRAGQATAPTTTATARAGR